jgi:hypothetical protein
MPGSSVNILDTRSPSPSTRVWTSSMTRIGRTGTSTSELSPRRGAEPSDQVEIFGGVLEETGLAQ